MNVGWHLEKRYRLATERLPDAVAAQIDRRVPFREWRISLNGQRRRQELVEEVASSTTFDLVVETGTFRGGTTKLLASLFDCPVWTVESNRRLFLYAQAKLRDTRNVTVQFDDSRRFLRRLAQSVGPDITLFAYLDAHWRSDLPLAEELAIIAKNWNRSLVMIDDFEVPGDPGYGFDDYGTGAALVESYLPQSTLTGWSLLYPASPSSAETGRRRGSCVLAAPQLRLASERLRLAKVF